MRIENIKELCVGCSACSSQCPKRCIQMKFDVEGFYYPIIDQESCVQCGICEQSCPALEPNVENSINNQMSKSSYYGWLKDPDLRFKSTSGGAFTALANLILKSNGVVFGAAFNYDKLILEHRSTEDVTLESLRKSKYIESYVGNSFRSIQDLLSSGRSVLFSGSPCQVAGLKRVVKDPDNLLTTVDFVCHGVPSARLFQEHLQHVTKKEKLISLDFRSKSKGWSTKYFGLKTKTKTKTKTIPYRLDSFYYGFMSKNAILRRSCYQCRYRNNHLADVTIADFWGYRVLDPQLNDEKGISLIICNNERGRRLVESIENFELHLIDNSYSNYVYVAKDYSKGYRTRSLFYEQYYQLGFERAAKKTFMKGTFIVKIKSFVKKFLRRLL